MYVGVMLPFSMRIASAAPLALSTSACVGLTDIPTSWEWHPVLLLTNQLGCITTLSSTHRDWVAPGDVTASLVGMRMLVAITQWPSCLLTAPPPRDAIRTAAKMLQAILKFS